MADDVFRIVFFANESGTFPFVEWFESIKDIRSQAIVESRLNRLRLGNFGDCKFVGKGVYELRIKHGSGYRIYFGKSRENLVMVICGGSKARQKQDIQMAQKIWAQVELKDE